MRAFCVLVLLASTLAACGGDTATKPLPIPAQDFAAAYVNASCEQATRCQSLAPYLAQQCLDMRSRLLTADDVAKAVAAGRITYDAQAARDCVDSVTATSCLALEYANTTVASCFAAVRGTLAPGAPCSGYFECAAGTCGASSDTCPATCPEVLHEGDACSLHAPPPCDPRQGLLCAAGTCVKPAKAGEHCLNSEGCQGELICVTPASGEGDGVCARLQTAGEKCSADADCARGLYCPGTGGGGGECAPRLAEGRPCAQDPDTVDAALRGAQCADGLLCKGAGLSAEGEALSGVCARPASVGQSCLSDRSGVQLQVNGCFAGLVCPGGVCANPPSRGLCTIRGECQSGAAYCDENGECMPLGENGAPCRVFFECKSNFCSDDGVCADGVNFCHES